MSDNIFNAFVDSVHCGGNVKDDELCERIKTSYINTHCKPGQSCRVEYELIVSGLSALDLSNSNVQSLEGIDDFKNIQTLNLSNVSSLNINSSDPNENFKKNFFPYLQKLPYLSRLILDDNFITDLTEISQLTTLRALSLNNNPITSDLNMVDKLANILDLQELYLSGCMIYNVSPFSSFKSLTTLDISHNTMSSLYYLQYTKLQKLYVGSCKFLNGNQISYIRCLPLVELDMSKDKVSDLQGIDAIPSLKKLWLNQNNLTDIYLIQYLTNLQYLNLSVNNIVDAQYIKNLTNISELDISNNSITSMDFAVNISNLNKFNIANNKLSKFLFINSNYIQWINISNNQIDDLDAFNNYSNVFYLNAANNNIKDINPLVTHCFSSLSQLDISNNQVMDISPMRYMWRYNANNFKFSNQKPTIYVTINSGENIVISEDQIRNRDNTIPDIENISNGGRDSRKDTQGGIIIGDVLYWDYITKEDDLTFDIVGKDGFNGTATVKVNINPISIIDANLKSVINQTLATIQNKKRSDNQDIKPYEMELLTSLNLSNKNIKNLSGLEYAKNLTSLNLSNNRIENLDSIGIQGVITNMPLLSRLDLSNNRLKDLTILNNIINKQKTQLILNNQQVKLTGILDKGVLSVDITELKNINNTTVQIISNISDDGVYRPESKNVLFADVNMSTSKTFTFTGEDSFGGTIVIDNDATIVIIEDENLKKAIYSELKINIILTENPRGIDMKKLVELDLSNCQISSIYGLESAVNLTKLDLSNNNILDMGSLNTLSKLDFNNNKVLLSNQHIVFENQWSDLYNQLMIPITIARNIDKTETSIINISDGGYIQYEAGGIYNIPPLIFWERLSSDTILSFNFEGKKGFNGVVIVKAIRDYRIDIKDINLKKSINENLGLGFNSYDISRQQIESIYALAAKNKGIKDIAGLEYAINLKELDLSENSISDMSKISNLKYLEKLDLSNQNIVLQEKWADESDNFKLKLSFLKGRDGLLPDIEILDSGYLNIAKQRIEWKNIDTNTKLSFKFVGKQWFTGVVSIYVRNDDTVSIIDNNLRKVLNKALGREEDSIYPITKEDMSKIYDLDAKYKNISTLSGLEYAINLKSLILSKNLVVDISYLANLINLNVLDLSFNNIININDLSNLVNLQLLYLNNNHISDFSIINKLINLKHVNIKNQNK